MSVLSNQNESWNWRIVSNHKNCLRTLKTRLSIIPFIPGQTYTIGHKYKNRESLGEFIFRHPCNNFRLDENAIKMSKTEERDLIKILCDEFDAQFWILPVEVERNHISLLKNYSLVAGHWTTVNIYSIINYLYVYTSFFSSPKAFLHNKTVLKHAMLCLS